MKAFCTISSAGNGKWLVRHVSSSLGEVEVTAPSREEALQKMQRELQYRFEMCPCSGEVLGTVELQINEGGNSP